MADKKWNYRVLLTWVAVILFAVLLAFELYFLYNKGNHRPLSNADIPQSTIDWFNNLIKNGSDIGGILGPDDRNPDDWNKYENIDSMLHVEDENFIIFYSKKDSVTERNKAIICMRYANEAIPMGELFMKNYPYPSQSNGRKLPIYLAKTVDDFRNICKQLNHGDPGTWAIGLYCFQYGVSGVYTDGILISPKAWRVPDSIIDKDTEDKYLKTTLWHEMNHFMYFTNWDYTQTTKPSVWFTEGLAEYFSGNSERLNYCGDHKKYSLTKDFMDGSNEYWVGMSAYLCLEKYFGKGKISDIVSNSYKNSIDKAIQMTIPAENLQTWDNRWHKYMESKEYRKYKK